MPRTLRSPALRRPQAVWWAVLVAVWFALLPTLGHALAFVGVAGAQRMEICTTQGTQTLAPVPAHSDDAAPEEQPATAQPHCALCLHQVDRCGPLPQAAASFALAASRQQQLQHWQVYFYFGKTTLWAPPRGPPTLAS